MIWKEFCIPRSRITFHPHVVAVLFLVSAATSTSIAAQTWPSLRGPGFDGTSAETGVFGQAGGVDLHLSWKIKLGVGYSSVVVAAGRTVTAFTDGSQDVVAAFSTEDGQRLWSYPLGAANPGHDGSHGGPIATPAIAGDRVFVLAPRGNLLALDLADGTSVWSTDLALDHSAAQPIYGFGSSPLVVDGVLIVQMGGVEHAVGGFDPATGELRWTAGDDVVSYQTPTPLTLGGRRQVVAAGMNWVFGIDPAYGRILWKWAHGGGGARGAVSLTPVDAGDGRLFLAHQDDASVLIRVDGNAVEKEWEGRAIRNSYNVPVVDDGHFYTYTSRFLTCVDVATGETLWRSRPPGDGFLILVDSRLVIVTKSGDLVLAEATPQEYRPIASRPIFDEIVWTPPSFAEGAIYARSLGELARIDVTTGLTTPTPPRSEVTRVGEPPSDSDFGRFLHDVRKASDKRSVVDRFLAAQESFPIVEEAGVVHFLYRGLASDVALAGDIFGIRTEQSMARLSGTDVFYISLEMPSVARVNYRFVVDYEEMLDPLNPRQTEVSYYRVDMEYSMSGDGASMSWLAMPDWREAAHLAPTQGARGRVEKHVLVSKHLGRQIPIRVYLPPGATEDERYPVVYVHGGGPALRRGAIPNSLDNLIGESVAPLIVVFIDEPPTRGRQVRLQLPFYERAFIEEILPFVDDHYATVASVVGRANIGHAFSAFYAFYFTLKYPQLFSKAGSQSAYMSDGLRSLLDPLLASLGDDPPMFYMDWGIYDLRSPNEPVDMVQKNREIFQTLRLHEIKVVGGEIAEGTGWEIWRNRTEDVFKTLFPLRLARDSATVK